MKASEIIKYSIFLVLFTFLFFIEDKIGIRAFSVALFMSLVYCKQNILILSPLYVGAAMIASFSLAVLIMSVAPPIVIALCYFIHYKLQRKIKLIHINLYMFLAQIPLIVLEVGSIYEVVNTVIALLLSQVFMYALVILIYAILAKKLKYKLTTDEIMAFCLVLGVFGIGLYYLNIGWFNAYYTVLALSMMLLLFIDKRGAIFIAVSLGIGASLAAADPFVLALSAMYGLTVSCFTAKSQYYAAIALLTLDIIFNAFFSPSIGYLNIISPAIGLAVAVSIPNRQKHRLGAFSVCFRERQGSRSLVNRERHVVANKLAALSQVFYEISDILYVENSREKHEADVGQLTRELSARCCQTCVGLKGCKDALGGGATDMILEELVAAAIDNGKATILDTPPFLSSRCRKIHGLISAANDLTESYLKGEEKRQALNEGRSMISKQMDGVGEILGQLKKDLDKSLSYDTALEEKLVEELNANNISATEAVIYKNQDKDLSLTLVVKEADCAKIALSDTIKAVLGIPMEVVCSEKLIKGMVNLHYERAPNFKVVYGDRQISKVEGEVSGDRHSAIRITNNKVMLILSDGMGSGKDASANSGYAISLIENFYKAGFDHQTIVGTVGRLLTLRNSEEFSAVDIAVIDTAEGYVDFIKMGGRESFIANKGSIEVIECGSLPIGILDDELSPVVENRRLQSGSFIILISDGVIDTIGREPLIELISETHTTNPDAMAALIINEVESLMQQKGHPYKDDALVLVAKVYKPV